jgi:predicted nucleotidyltransferase
LFEEQSSVIEDMKSRFAINPVIGMGAKHLRREVLISNFKMESSNIQYFNYLKVLYLHHGNSERHNLKESLIAEPVDRESFLKVLCTDLNLPEELRRWAGTTRM